MTVLTINSSNLKQGMRVPCFSYTNETLSCTICLVPMSVGIIRRIIMQTQCLKRYYFKSMTMKSLWCLFLVSGIAVCGNAQRTTRLSAEINYGLNGNFFVRSYNETGGPANKTYLYKKNFVGTIGGVQLSYRLNSVSSLSLGYSRSTNKGQKSFHDVLNGVDIMITDFNIRHNNDFFQLAYERSFSKKHPSWKYHAGVVLVSMQQQEISVENYASQVLVNERNAQNAGLQEAGVFAGIHFSKKIDTRLEAGLKARVYYLISVQSFEAITLTPTLTYHF